MYFYDKFIFGLKQSGLLVIGLTLLSILTLVISGIAIAISVNPVTAWLGPAAHILSVIFAVGVFVLAFYSTYTISINGKYRYLRHIHSPLTIFLRSNFVDAFSVFYAGFVNTFSQTNKLSY